MIRWTVAVLVCVCATGFSQPLTRKQAETLVMNVPEVLTSKAKHGCPKAETIEFGKHTAYFQVRNSCPVQGSGLIENYSVDLNTGEVWFDINPDKKISSPRMDSLRKRFLQRPPR